MTKPDRRVPLHHPQTASRVFSGEAVIITPAENIVRILNDTGSRIWELADGTRTVGEIAAALTQEFAVDPVEARASATAFVDELAAKGLVTFIECPPTLPMPPPNPLTAASQPADGPTRARTPMMRCWPD